MLFLIYNSVPTKVSRKYLEDGTKVRVSKLSGQIVPKPNPLFDRVPRSLSSFNIYIRIQI